MELKANKTFGVRLTEKRINKINLICETFGVSTEEMTPSQILDVILDNFNVNTPSEEIKEEKHEVNELVNIELSPVNFEKPQFSISSKLSEFHKKLIYKILTNTDVITDFVNMNKQGERTGVFNPINTDNEETNILNLLTGVLTGSANGMIIRKNVVPKKELKLMITNYLQRNE